MKTLDARLAPYIPAVVLALLALLPAYFVEQGRWGHALLVAGLVGMLVYSLARHKMALHRGVREATAKLREREETLEQRVAERTNALATLLEVSRTVASTLEMGALVGLILEQLKAVVDYTAARVWLVDGDDMVLLAERGPRADAGLRNVRVPMATRPRNHQVYRTAQPVIVDDMLAEPGLTAPWNLTPGALDTAPEIPRAWMGVPLIVRDRVIGMLSIGHDEVGHFAEGHAQIALAFASQAAVAVENARLYEAAQDRAAFEELQRLARELHDAVTQTLFSASLIAEVLPRIWARDPEQGAARLAELRELTRGALAEMRTLLLELRPAALTEMDLADLLKQLGEAFTGRGRVPVEVVVEGEGQLPAEVKVAFYRVAQEALNNVAKHASAGRVTIGLSYRPDAVAMTVRDDGRGFDADGVPSGHFGVGIMRERADAIGGSVVVTSCPGDGTSVELTWPVPREVAAA